MPAAEPSFRLESMSIYTTWANLGEGRCRQCHSLVDIQVLKYTYNVFADMLATTASS